MQFMARTSIKMLFASMIKSVTLIDQQIGKLSEIEDKETKEIFCIRAGL